MNFFDWSPNTYKARNLRKKSTVTEKMLWEKLRNRQLCNVKFRRQQPIKNFVADFCAKEEMLVIEIDGNQHRNKENKEYDQMRTACLEGLGYAELRFWNNEIKNNLGQVLLKIQKHIASLAT